MKKFIVKHKILTGVLIILTVALAWFVAITKHLDIPSRGIEQIKLDGFLGKRMCFVNNEVVENIVDILNSYIVTDASFDDIQGSHSPNAIIRIYYDGGKNVQIYQLYNYGLIYHVNENKYYKKIFGGFLAEEITEEFSKYKHMSIPYDWDYEEEKSEIKSTTYYVD